MKFCGAYLVDNLTAEKCLGVRAILVDSYHCHQDPINRLDTFIKQNVCRSRPAVSFDLGEIELIVELDFSQLCVDVEDVAVSLRPLTCVIHVLQIGEVLKSPEIASLKHIQVELIQSTWAEMDNTNERHLFEMVLDWLKATDESLDVERLTEKVSCR